MVTCIHYHILCLFLCHGETGLSLTMMRTEFVNVQITETGQMMMMARKDHIVPAIKVRPEAISKAIGQISAVLDHADYGTDVVCGVQLGTDATLPEIAYAWMMAAFLIADMTEVDGMSLRNLQNSIWRGTQDVLWY